MQRVVLAAFGAIAAAVDRGAARLIMRREGHQSECAIELVGRQPCISLGAPLSCQF